jgi:hypothetical protein
MKEIDQKEFDLVMKDYEEAMNQIVDEESRVNNRILKAIKNVKSEKFIEGLMECIEESEVRGKWAIVRKPCGDYQRENYGVIKGIWVDQYVNGGYTGDNYEGNIYIKLKESRWLMMGYSM